MGDPFGEDLLIVGAAADLRRAIERRLVVRQTVKTRSDTLFLACSASEAGVVPVVHRMQCHFKASEWAAVDFADGADALWPELASFFGSETKMAEGAVGDVPKRRQVADAARRLRDAEEGRLSLLDYAAVVQQDVRLLLASLGPPPGSITTVEELAVGVIRPMQSCETASLATWTPISFTAQRAIDVYVRVRFRRPGRWCAVMRGTSLS